MGQADEQRLGGRCVALLYDNTPLNVFLNTSHEPDWHVAPRAAQVGLVYTFEQEVKYELPFYFTDNNY